MPAKLQTAVLGATGYAGFELARLLLRHPRLSPPRLLRREGDDAVQELADIFPHISGNGSYPLQPFSWDRMDGVELLFLATPHEVSREWAPELLRRGLRVIDLSGAWRLKDPAHLAVYGFGKGNAEHEALSNAAVYGLPELHRDLLKDAALVANPGCYATSIILALAPLLAAGLVELGSGIICDSKSGVSGAGKQPTARTHFVEVTENLSAYSVFGHRHTGEVLEQLQIASAQLVFTPHLLPIARGILSTIYLRLRQPADAAAIEGCLRAFYQSSPWVRVFTSPRLPQIQFCARTNFCDLGFCLGPDRQRLIVISCLDNLLKGAAGQAVQNMNLMYGWGEQEGLN